MNRRHLLFSTIALPLDYIMLVVAGILAYQLRFESFVRTSLPVRFDLSLWEFFPTLLTVAGVWLVLFAFTGLYNLQRQLKFSQEVAKIFFGCTSGLAFIILLFFFNPNLFNSRFIILAGWGLALVLVSLGRIFLRLVRTALYRRGYGVNRILLVGEGEASQALEQLFNNKVKLGFVVVKRVKPSELALEQDANEVDEVLVGDTMLSHEDNLKILEFCISHHLGFKYVADMFEAQSHNVVSHTYAGIPIIEIKRTALDGWGRVAKRLFDLILATLLFLILSPLLLLLTFIIWFDSGRPIIVSLARVGEHGRIFRIYKFRSMIKDADKLKDKLMPYNERVDGPLFKITNDPRVTRFGRFLRRTSFDELPQLWNVIKGQMSLVGPRPHEPGEVANYENEQRKLLSIKPGITGLAQVSGRSSLRFVEEAKLDTFYVENWSLGQDLLILIKTVIVVWQRQSAV